jgi:drug/metabolite transporter (DMT)-like permease
MAALPFVFWRGSIGALALLAIALLVGSRVGGTSRYPRLSVLPRDRQRALIVAALAGALLNLAMFAAFLRTEVAIALITFYTFPALVTLAAVPLYGERLDRLRIGALLLSSVGLVMVVLAPLTSAGHVQVDPVGVGLALFAAVCQATFILISGRGWAPMPNLHVSTIVVGMAAVVALPLTILAGDLGGLLKPFEQPEAWVWILLGGITGAAIPTTAFITGIGLIGPSRAAILMTIEPLVGVTIAALFLGEQPTIVQLIGGAAVLTAAAILQVAPRNASATEIVVEPEMGPLV